MCDGMGKKRFAAFTAVYFFFGNFYWIVWQFFQSENLFTDTASSAVIGLVMLAAAGNYFYMVNKEKTEKLSIFYFLFPLAFALAEFPLLFLGCRFVGFFSAKGSSFSIVLMVTITLWYMAFCSLCMLIRQKNLALPKGVTLSTPSMVRIDYKQIADPHNIRDANPQKRSRMLANVIFVWASVCAGLFLLTSFVNLIYPFIDMSKIFVRFG